MLACGGTGGHIFPAISVAEEIRRRHPDVTVWYVCGKKDIESAIFRPLAAQTVAQVDSAPFRGAASLLSPSFLLRLLSGVFRSAMLIWRQKPALVAGFGGHYSFPVIVAAKCLGVRTVVHEQNVVPGTANRVLARWADGVAVSFEETRPYFKGHTNVRVTGNPIRASIETARPDQALAFFGFDAEKLTLLVLGGSQGAESINVNFLQALGFLPAALKARLQVLHLCGKLAPEASELALRQAGVAGRAYSFFERMDLAYGAADLAVGRAGATFLAEIASTGLGAILIPYPHAGGHQLANARAFSASHRGVVVEQKDLTPAVLAGLVETHLKKRDPQARAAARESNARKKLADFIEETMIKK